jgi:hypothetical protein
MKHKTLIVVLAAALIIILGGLAYLLSSGKLTSSIPFEREVAQYETMSESDELDAIETDLNNTELQNLDKELVDIQAELEASE